MRARPPRDDSTLSREIAAGAVRSTVRSALLWTLGGQWGGYVLQLATTVVLARLLQPADFGLVGMALTLTVFVDQFRTLGLSQAVVQRKDLTWHQVDALFWVNAATGVVLGALVVCLGPLAAAFYGRSELVTICAVLGAAYVVSGLGVQHNALLNRHLRFRAIALRTSASRLVASAAAIVAALAGAGYWSLVVLQVTQTVVALVVVWTAVRWRPGPPRRFTEALPLLRFGAGVSTAGLLYTVARNADNVLIGRVLGADALGLYARAYGLLLVPLRQLKGPLGSIVEPVLSSMQDQPARYRQFYCAAIQGLSHVGMPLVAVLAVVSHELVLVLLGEQWLAAVPVFQILAIAGLVQIVSSTTGWLYVSSGRSGAFARWAAASSAITVLSFALGLRWGIEGVAVAYAVGQTLMLLPSFHYASRGTSVTTSDILAAMRRPVVLALLTAAAAWWARGLLKDAPPVVLLLVTPAIAALVWAAALVVWGTARAEVSSSLDVLRRRRGRVQPQAAESVAQRTASAAGQS
jgi:O-antigen/teichoic acid export membrane protein